MPRGEGDFVTVLVPEQFERAVSLLSAVARPGSFRLKSRILNEAGIAVTSVPLRRP